MSGNKSQLKSLVPRLEEDNVLEEQFPHVVDNLILFWGEPEFLDQLERLLKYSYDPSRPNRSGFPFKAIQELEFILQEHIRMFPNIDTEYTKRMNDPWGAGN